MCLSLEQLTKAVKRAEAALALTELFGEKLARLCGEEKLASSAKWVRERMCVRLVRTFGEDVRMVFVKSVFIDRGFSLKSDGYKSALNVARA